MKFHTFVSLVRKMLIFMSGFSRFPDLKKKKSISKIKIGWRLRIICFILTGVNVSI